MNEDKLKETKQKVKESRIGQLEIQIANTLLNIAIYKKVYEQFQREEDRLVITQEQEKLIRFQTALDVTDGGDW